MAIVQISKIQQRSGNLVDLPQLDNAEFGWATDQHRLFIGRTGSTVSDENVEVLTSYSDISFSQIVGSDGGNFNIDAATNGQVLTYVSSTNTWENYPSAAVLANASFKLNLGNANSLSISGGSIGYVLETDGYGNLSWTSKGTLRANISGLSNATPIIMTVSNTLAYQNGTAITISGANGVANSNVNSRTFYVKLASNFPTSGNVELYTTQDLAIGNAAIGTSLTYTNSPNAIATTSLGGSGTSSAAGSNNQIQFNNSGLFGASANLTFDGNTMAVTGIANVSSNVNVAGNINLTRQLISTQSTGTAPFSVVSTTRVSNLNVAYANVADHINTAVVTTGTHYPVLANATSGNVADGANANLSFNAATGNLSTTLLSVTSNANVGNLGTAGLITATGNVTGGNLGTAGLITATGNVTGGNLVTAGALSVTGNANVGNLGTATAIITTGNITTINSGLLQNGNSNVTITANGNVSISAAGATAELVITSTGVNVAGTLDTTGNTSVLGIKTDNYYYANGVSISFAGSYSNTNVTSLLAAFGSNTISTTGNISGGNINTAGKVTASELISNVATGTAPFTVTSTTQVANLSVATAGTATTAGTVTTNAQPNITSVSTSFTSLTFANAQTISGNNMTLTTGANTNVGTITGNWSLSTGSRLQATYADLAEYYQADAYYDPGTVLEFGGEKEVTIAEDGTTRVAGVVSTDPAYAMNAKCPGIAVAVALQGRVPTKVRGTVRKGDMMVSAGNGYARPRNNPQMGTVIGKALENFDGVEGVIEVAVGRL